MAQYMFRMFYLLQKMSNIEMVLISKGSIFSASNHTGMWRGLLLAQSTGTAARGAKSHLYPHPARHG